MKTRIGLLFGSSTMDLTSSRDTMWEVAELLKGPQVELVPIYVDNKGNWYSHKKFMDAKIYDHLDEFLRRIGKVRLHKHRQVFRLVKERSTGWVYETKTIDEIFMLVDNKRSDYLSIVNYLNYLGIPYAGCNSHALTILSDAVLTKDILSAHRLAVPQWTWCIASDVEDDQKELSRKVKRLGFPLFVYPAQTNIREIREANDMEELMDAMVSMQEFSDKFIIERKYEDIVTCQISAVINGAMVDLSDLQKEVDGKLIPCILTEESEAISKQMVRKAIQALTLDGIVKFELWYDKAKDEFMIHLMEPMPAHLSKEAFESIQLDPGALVKHLMAQAKARAKDFAKR